MRFFALALFLAMLSFATGELLPNGSFARGLSGWQPHYFQGQKPDYLSLEIIEGAGGDDNFALRVQKTAEGSAVLINTFSPRLKSETPYRFKFSYQARATATGIDEPVLLCRLTITGTQDGKPHHRYKWLRCPNSSSWALADTGPLGLVTLPDCKNLLITFFFSKQGEYLLDEISLQEVDIEAPVLEAAGEKLYFQARSQNRELPPEAGTLPSPLALYNRNPGEVYPDSVPRPDELLRGLHALAVPGEYVTRYCALYASAEAKLGPVQVSELRTPEGDLLPDSLWQEYQVEHLTRFARRPYYRIIPERLVDWSGGILSAGGNRILCLQAKIPAGQRAGTYSGQVRLTDDLMLPLTLEVLPFQLEPPEVDYLMYATVVYRHDRLAEGETIRMLKEIRELGINGIVHHGGIWDEPTLQKYCRILAAAGLTGSTILDFGSVLENHVYRRLHQQPPDPNQKYLDKYDHPEIRAGFQEYLEKFAGWFRQYDPQRNWYYQGFDEPAFFGLERVLWEYPLAKAAGVKVSGTVYTRPALRQLGPNIDLSLLSYRSAQEEQEFQAVSRETGVKYYLLGAGSYFQQQGFVAVNRFLAGAYLFKLGLPGHVSWSYQYHCQEFEQLKIAYNLAWPRQDCSRRRSDSTLQAEGLREGIIDYRFLQTFRNLKTDPAQQQQDQELLQRLIQEIIPWSEDFRAGSDCLSPANLDYQAQENLRLLLARRICARVQGQSPPQYDWSWIKEQDCAGLTLVRHPLLWNPVSGQRATCRLTGLENAAAVSCRIIAQDGRAWHADPVTPRQGWAVVPLPAVPPGAYCAEYRLGENAVRRKILVVQ
ncbi:MAG: hypothetical protein GX564_01640 [Oligosphaeraceae bacterium]|nr:hypothetical protein [Oligosphaeraceae bacterium]